MSFLHLLRAKEHASESKTVSQNPSQAVAAGIFQLNTDVATFRHIVDTADTSDYTPEHRDRLDNISQDIMVLVKDTLDKLSDFFGWPYDQTSTVPLTRDQEIKGHKLAKDFQSVLVEFQKALQLAAGDSESRSYSPSEAIAAGIVQIKTCILDYHGLVEATGTNQDTPEHRKKLEQVARQIMQLVKDTSARLKVLGELEGRRNPVTASSSVNSKNRVTKLKKVVKRWWKSDSPAPDVSQGNSSDAVRLAKEFDVVLQEFQNAQQLLASKHSSVYEPPSILTEMAGRNLEGLPFLLDQKSSEAAVEEWGPRFKEIENQVQQVYDIVGVLMDLAVLAHEQAAISIDDMIMDAQADQGSYAITSLAKHHQLYVGSTRGRSCSSLCWWLLIASVIVIIVIVLFVIL